MENKNIILQELSEISQAVANISNRNLYSVPLGYFDELASNIMFRIKLMQISHSSDIYAVPEGYFEKLADEILSKLYETEFTLSNPYSVPAEYFTNLPDAILEKIRSQRKLNVQSEVFEEMQLVAPLLNSISKENIYSVPDGYFESLNANAAMKPAAKVVPLATKTRRWIIYAAAACFITILAIGGYFLNLERVNQNSQNELYGKVMEINIEQSLAALSDDEISNYLENHTTPFSDIITPIIEEPDIEQLLDNASDEEIKQYLNDNKEPDSKNIKGI